MLIHSYIYNEKSRPRIINTYVKKKNRISENNMEYIQSSVRKPWNQD